MCAWKIWWEFLRTIGSISKFDYHRLERISKSEQVSNISHRWLRCVNDRWWVIDFNRTFIMLVSIDKYDMHRYVYSCYQRKTSIGQVDRRHSRFFIFNEVFLIHGISWRLESNFAYEKQQQNRFLSLRSYSEENKG